MFIVHVDIAVLPDRIGAFIEATQENARASLQEPGIARFDLVQRLDDPGLFTLVEVYRDDQAPAAHKATAHYARWAETVAPMMARPRQSLRYRNLFPGDPGWDTAAPGGHP
jgi:quinol monooxygenase YgiN